MAHSFSRAGWDRVCAPLGSEKELVQRDPNGGATSANHGTATVEAMTSDELNAMITTDDRHWWYRGRRRVVRAMLDGLALPAPCAILDAGCGSGRTLDELTDYGDVRGVDVSRDAVAATRARGHDAYLADVGDLPFRYVGKHRRAKLKDVLALKTKIDAQQAALDALAENTETLIRDHGL